MADVNAIVRPAERSDCEAIKALIQELANFNKLPDGPKMSYQDLVRDGFDTSPPLFTSYVATVQGKVVGYALFFYIYSTWQGKALFLEDLYVCEEYRKRGIGGLLFDNVVEFAVKNDCCKLDFTVYNWNNSAQKFYLGKGAADITVSNNWHCYRMEKEALLNLCSKLKKLKMMQEKKYPYGRGKMADVNAIVRPAERSDCEAIKALIQELANFEKQPDGPKISYQDLVRDGFDTSPPLFTSYVATVQEKVVGYAIFYYVYSTWKGKALFLEDLYVCEEYRNKGIGGLLFDTVVQFAVKNDCCKLDFSVLSWNPAQKFYSRKGAADITVSNDWHCYRMEKQALLNLCSKLKK
ncbi:spermidine/spermine N(1)-acetyltransferase-like protein 1 [Leptopilina heterotoma]|uniref:spermidine/spermine N(1)-acetyltransferase-like protein 1 n=1 Tax=Leptopilina heterotoma TaxID=63436 RepID=UPI001CA8E7BB|nr:spermidine/spermine N(1)-acetyltransferase-like protein 1 [Leptopilina heterotoma]